jgi:hypothetical protein
MSGTGQSSNKVICGTTQQTLREGTPFSGKSAVSQKFFPARRVIWSLINIALKWYRRIAYLLLQTQFGEKTLNLRRVDVLETHCEFARLRADSLELRFWEKKVEGDVSLNDIQRRAHVAASPRCVLSGTPHEGSLRHAVEIKLDQ